MNNKIYDEVYLEWLTNKTAGKMAQDYYKRFLMTELQSIEQTISSEFIAEISEGTEQSVAEAAAITKINDHTQDEAERASILAKVTALVTEHFNGLLAAEADEAKREVEEADVAE